MPPLFLLIIFFFFSTAFCIYFFELFPIPGTPFTLKRAPRSSKKTCSTGKETYSIEKGGTISLTFDDGPTHPYTEKILDILKARNVKATFFVTGRNVSVYPELLCRIINEGHEVGNHSFSHAHLIFFPSRKIREEILLAEKEINNCGGKKPIWFRPPYGQKNIFVLREAIKLGYKVVNWSVGSFDWWSPGVSQIIANVIKKVQDGEIVLLHDGSSDKISLIDRNQTVEALPFILDELERQNFKCVTLTELFANTNPS